MNISRMIDLASMLEAIPKRKFFFLLWNIEWVVNSNGGLAEVEDDKLAEAFGIADPKLNMPSRKAVKRKIVKFYNKKRQEFDQEISEIAKYCKKVDTTEELHGIAG